MAVNSKLKALNRKKKRKIVVPTIKMTISRGNLHDYSRIIRDFRDGYKYNERFIAVR